jgi:hypothetical protein
MRHLGAVVILLSLGCGDAKVHSHHHQLTLVRR